MKQHDNPARAYLDIETTGFASGGASITVIGIYKITPGTEEVYQLVEKDITAANLLRILQGVELLYTFNGSCFDLPFIKNELNLDLKERYKHIDLKYACWKKNLYGGLKRVEEILDIDRESHLCGMDAIRLWYEYKEKGRESALQELLDYNKEDIVNLHRLVRKLESL